MKTAEQGTEVSVLFADFSRRITDVEEQFRLLRQRLLVVSKTLLSQNEKLNKDIFSLKEEARKIKDQFDRVKESQENIIKKSAEFTRREELKSFERFIKMFDPLKFVTEDDVKRLIKTAGKS